MSKLAPLFIVSLLFLSCAPVLNENLMREGRYMPSLSDLKQNPDLYRGNTFILGGIIVKTSITKEGSLIEALYVPVNTRGYLKSLQTGTGRFLAIYKNRDILDPLIFEEKREITLAGEFVRTQSSKIGEADYVYPLFSVREIYLWPEKRERDYYYPPYPPYPPYPYYRPWYDYRRQHDPFYPWRYY